MSHPFYSAKVLAEKRVIARDLIFIKGYTKKEAAKEVGISQPTMSNWVNKYKWNDEESNKVRKMGGLNILMNEFFDHLEGIEGPVVRGMVKQHWIDYVGKIPGR